MAEAWWKESAVYQIYPRSFFDSNGDGIGDLQGIIAKLDYIQRLGVDVLWLSPIYQSPNDDNGYDISDYFKIMKEFGTLVDFENLLEAVHQRGMKLVMDLVVNHTSDEHLWFVESVKDAQGTYGDYYIWRPGRDGGPPNNWGAFFGGSAWQYCEQRDAYYLHLFSKKQPDLNWEHPGVRRDILDMMRWWLNNGVDGFRMDVINLLSKHPELPDMPAQENQPYPMPLPYVANGPKIHEYLQEMKREVLDDFPCMTVGEMIGVTPELALRYVDEATGPLNMVFHFEHMYVDHDWSQPGQKRSWKLTEMKAILRKWQETLQGRGWNALYWNNHDQPRSLSRFGSEKRYPVESAKMLAAVLFLQQGTPFIYQGEELGMTNCAFERIEDYRDVATVGMYEQFTTAGYPEDQVMAAIQRLSRDNARTPMQWSAEPHGGFTTGKPWIKVNPNYKEINAAAQMEEPHSVFNFYRKLLALRNSNSVLIYGAYKEILPDSEDVYAFLRTQGGEMVLVAGNFRHKEVKVDLQPWVKVKPDMEMLLTNYQGPRTLDDGVLLLEPFEVVVYRVS